MKDHHIIWLAALGAAPLATFAADTTNNAHVQVTFQDPENFTDVKDDQFGTEKGREQYLSELRKHIERRAESLIPEGQTLRVTVTNVDMAGDFEPWRGPQFSDVRIVKDIYPPRIDLSYELVDSDGAVVKEGSAELRNLSFQQTITLSHDDELRYEKDMLTNWLRREFKRAQ